MIFIFDEICFYILHKGILTNKFKSIHFIREITITPNIFWYTANNFKSRQHVDVEYTSRRFSKQKAKQLFKTKSIYFFYF